MFNAVTSLLFGASEEEIGACDLRTSTLDDDWVLVELPAGMNIQQMEKETEALSQSSPGEVPATSTTPVRIPENHPVEESWFVTPPPCFTAGGQSPVAMETNPMENLLIEHPSMSVYVQRPSRNSSGETTESSSDSSGPRQQQRRDVVHRPPQRAAAIAARVGIVEQAKMKRHAQRVQERHEKKAYSKTNLQRANLTSCRPIRASHHNRNRGLMCKQPRGRVNKGRC
ncbi:tumor protein p53-inducible nuclear protein 1-like [Branchiostoma lanceolatum]|uniref:tumor protein p53-inducible nuclear protein 1-like n=1 Tax=Branchiostoma lanceolatum TaxID=7740 RepID=UPI003457336D